MLVFDCSLRWNLIKREYVFMFMDKIFEKGYVEEVLFLFDNKEWWYFFIFGVYYL